MAERWACGPFPTTMADDLPACEAEFRHRAAHAGEIPADPPNVTTTVREENPELAFDDAGQRRDPIRALYLEGDIL